MTFHDSDYLRLNIFVCLGGRRSFHPLCAVEQRERKRKHLEREAENKALLGRPQSPASSVCSSNLLAESEGLPSTEVDEELK